MKSIVDFLKFFLSPILNDTNSAISLTRMAFVYIVYLAGETWQKIGIDGKSIDISLYHFLTIFVILLYMMFKDRSLSLIEKIVDVFLNKKREKEDSSIN